MISPSEQGFSQNIQQPLQQGIQFGYPSQQPQQDMSQFGYTQPVFQQGLAQLEYARHLQQGLAELEYARQLQQGFAQPQAQQGTAHQGYAQQQPQQDFGGQAGQFASGYDFYQQPSRAESDVPRDRRGPKNYARSDERIRELICERVIQNLLIDVSDVSIEVQSGRVVLDGTVPNRQMKHAIEDVVDRCWGVQNIENNIRVQPGQESGSSAGGFGQESRKIAQSGGGFANASSGASGSSKFAGSESKGKDREESHSM
jgi:osmotically-inducible protein OsmY